MKTKVLITVKTYPTLSRKYGELVCTAGLREDGSWIRIYPVPYRSMEFYTRYKKYQWIELDLVRNTQDPRLETYRPVKFPPEVELGDVIGTVDPEWSVRRRLVLKKVYTNLDTLIREAKDMSKITSLATFKPTKILDFKVEKVTSEWKRSALERFSQTDLFDDPKALKDYASKLPYKFSYFFEDDSGKQSTLMIEDWEIGALFWKCLESSGGDEDIAIKKVRQKYLDDLAKTKDIYLFLGTTKSNHFRSKNPFIIIGLFYPNFSLGQFEMEM
ncbi:MAG: hypothetical protein WCH46_07505 [bacterium]